MASTQRTLAQAAKISGIGLHSGKPASLTLEPAGHDEGIRFIRTDIKNGDNVIPARWDRVVDTRLCTVVANQDGASVATIEHLMAALRGCLIDNVTIKIDGPEIPIMDGSATPFVTLIEQTGTTEQAAKRRMIRVLEPVSVEDDGKLARLVPGDVPAFTGSIDFDHPVIGVQEHAITLVNGNFCHDLADCRTFGFMEQVEMLRKNGLALGGSLENAIVLDRETIVNPEGLRRPDEFIRHKLLDAIGDLYLAGHAILGTYEGHKSGHDMNNRLLHELFANENAWEWA